MSIILRTHGGLGNQIFQIFFARLYADKKNKKLFEIHDINYPHAFQRSSAIETRPEPNALKKFISKLRISKILVKLFGLKERPISILGDAYIDGYFQNLSNLSSFDIGSLKENINFLKKELKINSQKSSNHLVHIRLGDFFLSDEEAKFHLEERLKYIQFGSDIITNRDTYFENNKIKETLSKKGCTHIVTKNFSPEDLLILMTNYKTIDANDSTLVFWASVLGNVEVNFKDKNLIKLNKFLLQF